MILKHGKDHGTKLVTGYHDLAVHGVQSVSIEYDAPRLRVDLKFTSKEEFQKAAAEIDRNNEVADAVQD